MGYHNHFIFPAILFVISAELLCFLLAPSFPFTFDRISIPQRFSPVSHFVLGLNLVMRLWGLACCAGAINFPFQAPEFAMLLLLFAVTLWVGGF